MNTLATIPFATPANWVTSMLNITGEEMLEYVPKSSSKGIATIALMLEISSEPDQLLSAFILMRHFMHTNDKTPAKDTHAHKEFLIEVVNSLSEDRWEEMLSMGVNVMRECVRIFSLLESPPSSTFMMRVCDAINEDGTSADLLVRIWFYKNWTLTSELIYIAQNSYSAWWFIASHNQDQLLDSKSVMTILFKHSESKLKSERWLWRCYRSLVGSNGSCLEYLMHIDVVHGGGMKQTIDTVNGLDLWDTVLYNPGATPIINYVLDNFSEIKFGAFPTKSKMLDWLIPIVGASPLADKFITVNDINIGRVGNQFFSNAFAIDLIIQWLHEENFNLDVLNGLVEIATSMHKYSAEKAINIIESGYNIDGVDFVDLINDAQWSKLLSGEFSHPYAKFKLSSDNFQLQKIGLIRQSGVVPHWIPSFENDYGWMLLNLTQKTVSNFFVDHDLWAQTLQNVHMLTYENWDVLLQTDFGMKLGIDNIGYVVAQGLLFELLRSPFMTKEILIQLDETTDAFECAGDDELIAIISRDDAFEISLPQVYSANHDLCQELLMVWYEPSRLERVAGMCGMDLRSYLSVM